MDPIERFVEHVEARGFFDLPEAAVAAAKTFILDTLGVGILGSAGPRAGEIAASMSRLAGNTVGGEARVWATGKLLPAASAALVNAYQAHNSEYDCLHEAAVAHVMTVVLPVALAGAERMGDIDGKRLIEAVALGVDVAASLGIAATSGLRFFRPAAVGTFGATAALSKLMRLDADALRNAFSIAYGQLGGTMQAHTEGSMLLALQMGFAARNAVTACELAAAGVEGPRNILKGPFGFYRLIEAGGEPARVAADLGRVWRIAELAHKPFPSGRATHGIVDACLALRGRPGFDAAAIETVTARVPPLIQHLVGRPVQTAMAINYARLCAAYVGARALLGGTIRVEDFTDAAYADEATQALARRFRMEVVDVGNPNALVPIEIELRMADGRRLSASVSDVLGSIAKPLTREAHLAKFRANAAMAEPPLPVEKAERLIGLVDGLDRVADVRALVDAVVPG
jgi:2-methylcitrate dehydratase PrpD